MPPNTVRERSIRLGTVVWWSFAGSPSVVVLLLGGLSGCATHTLSAATTLSTAGQQAATQMAQNVDISKATLQQAKAALAFTDGYNNVPNASDSLSVQIVAWQTNLSTYSQVLQHLSAAYAALGALASYNSSASFNTAANDLASSVNAFAKSVGARKPVLPTDVSTLVDAGGDAILSDYQAEQVKKASDALLVQLNQIISILSADDVRNKVVPGSVLVANDIDAAAQVLYSSGAYSYAPLANQIGQPLGLTATTSFDALASKNRKLLAGFRNAELQTANDQTAAIGQSYDKSENLLEALRPLHAAIDAGTPLDLTTVDQIVAELQMIAAVIQAPKASSSTTR